MAQKQKFGRKIQSLFFAGLLVLIPLVLTAWVVYQVFVGIDSVLSAKLSEHIFQVLGMEYIGKSIPGLGLLGLVLTILAVGFFARGFFGRNLIALSEFIVKKIPVIRIIYSTFQQISEAFLSDKSETFKQAVLFEYPRKGIYSVGFITQDTKGLVQEQLDKDTYSIFLPTTPNPTSGFLLFVPKKEVIHLNIGIEEALKLVVSGGAIIPKPLADKLKEETN